MINNNLQTKCVIFPDEARQQDELLLAQPQIKFMVDASEETGCVNLVTTPKSGTHLLIKILTLLGVSHKSKSINISYAPHLCDYADFLPTNYKDAEKVKESFLDHEKYIITVRDPKDFIISYLQWISKEMEQGIIEKDPLWFKTSISEKLDQAFAGLSGIKFEPLKKIWWAIGNYFVAARIRSMGPKHILFLKFEDMIGPELGGSSKEKQIEVLTDLCEFTGVKVTAKKLDQLTKLMLGGTLTYISQKKVGKWKDYFSQKHLKIYNHTFAFLEPFLGYSS